MAIEGYPLIMVVEDDLDLRTIYTEILSHNGFETVGYADAESALEAVLDGERSPRLIVLDYMLPGEVNGDQFLKMFSSLPNIQKVPVIVVSALSDETKEIVSLKSHPWVVASFNKGDMAANKLVDFITAYFGLTK